MNQPSGSIFGRMLKLYIAVLVVLALYIYSNPIERKPTLYEINRETHELLHQLIKTKYFRMIRVNLNRECELWVRNKICKSKSCTVCRCDQKDIPTNWIKTDKVKQELGGQVDLWEKQRDNDNDSLSWIWHVEDEENDEGEYFDLYTNIESFTNYDGNPIWKLVYEQNCFNGPKANKTDVVCKQQAVFYKVISGLHTSISTHLSMLYKNISTEAQIWADLKSGGQFFVNYSEYRRRVLDHPDRIDNLHFIYQIYLRAIKQISQYLIKNYTIHTENIVEDLHTSQILVNLSKKFQNYQFKPFDVELGTFFYPQNPKVKAYQKYIHNISRLMNCVECEKCRLFGKMQTYGIGTALKILLGYNAFYKRNEMVALFNAWNKISMSIDFYYRTVGAPQIQQTKYDFRLLRLFGTVFGAFVLICFLVEYGKIQQKLRLLLKNGPEEKESTPETVQDKEKS